MKVLFLNWRDPINPSSGGAEILNLHIIQSLQKMGNSIIWYGMAVKGLPEYQEYQNIRIIRRGGLITHFLFWPIYYFRGDFGKVDLIFDCIHGTGYWAGIIAPTKKIVTLVCEVAQNIWDEMWPFPFSFLGKIYERLMYKFYFGRKYWTISNSTKNDLVRFGIKENVIAVIPMGYDAVKLTRKFEKFSEPTAIFVGRLCAMKGIKDAIMAISFLKNWRLIVVGIGKPDYESELKNMAIKLNLAKRVEFRGFVPQPEKFKLYSQSWVLLAPSSREGWGMTIPEANSVGTPAIGYNVPGLREVLPYYSPTNRLIDPNPTALASTLIKFNMPIKAINVPFPGWNELEKFVSKKDF